MSCNQTFRKKNISIYMNCQGEGIKFFFDKLKMFNITLLENYKYIYEQRNIPIDVIKKTDIFIYQPVKGKNGIYSTEDNIKGNITSFLPRNCLKISIPYIYNSALWCLYCDTGKYIGMTSITKLIDEGLGLPKIIQMFLNKQINFNYDERYKKTQNILISMEKECEIKVSQYIDQNIRKHKLFFTQNHPTSRVFIHCVNQMLEYLNISKRFDSNNYPENITGLPGFYTHTSYDRDFWQFEYEVNYNYDESYIPIIKKIYNSYINNL